MAPAPPTVPYLTLMKCSVSASLRGTLAKVIQLAIGPTVKGERSKLHVHVSTFQPRAPTYCTPKQSLYTLAIAYINHASRQTAVPIAAAKHAIPFGCQDQPLFSLRCNIARGLAQPKL